MRSTEKYYENCSMLHILHIQIIHNNYSHLLNRKETGTLKLYYLQCIMFDLEALESQQLV